MTAGRPRGSDMNGEGRPLGRGAPFAKLSFLLGSLAQTLDDGRIGHAAALAHGLKAVTAPGALEFTEQG